MERQVVVGSAGSVYPKPISLLVQTASHFDSNIYLQKGNDTINAKSMVGMLGMCLRSGDEITVLTSGKDEYDAFHHIEDFLSTM